jgi:hypothetical protein
MIAQAENLCLPERIIKSVDRPSMTTPELTIDPELKSLLPELTREERWQLETSLLDYGCLSPLTAWNNVVLDGHNRFELCRKHNLPFEVKELTFPSKAEAKSWMLKNQLARRNLTPFQRAEIVLKFKPLIAEQAKQHQGSRTDISQELGKCSDEADSVDTMKVLGGMAEMSHESLRKAERIIQQGDEAVIQKLRTGATSINKEYENIRKKEDRKEKSQAFKEEHHVAWVGDMSTPLEQYAKHEPISFVFNLVTYFSENYLIKMVKKLVNEMLIPGKQKKFWPCLVETARKIVIHMDDKSRRQFFDGVLKDSPSGQTVIVPLRKNSPERQSYSCGVRFEPDPDDDYFDWITDEERTELREMQKVSQVKLVPQIRNYTIQSIPEHKPDQLLACLFSLFKPLYREKLLYALARKMFAQDGNEHTRNIIVTLADEFRSDANLEKQESPAKHPSVTR